MQIRRERSNFFDIGKLKSPHVLDLRQKIIQGDNVFEIPSSPRSPDVLNFRGDARRREGLKTRKKKRFIPVPEFDDALVQERILKELAGIERRDVELAAYLTAQNQRVRGRTRETQNFQVKLIPARSNDRPAAILTRGLMGENLAMQSEDLVSQFFQKKEQAEAHKGEIQPVEEKSMVFIMVAAVLAGFLFGGFLIHKGLAVKEKTIQKGVAAYRNFASARESLREFNFSGATKDFTQAYESLVSAEEELNSIGETTVAIVERLPFESKADSSLSLLRASKHVAKAGEFLSSGFTFLPLDDAVSSGSFLKVLTGEKKDSQAGYLIDVFEAFAYKLVSAENELLKAGKEMSKVKTEDFPEEFRENINDLHKKIPTFLNLVRTAKDYSGISSLLLGGEGPKRYLILFQNSSELRPTGGFIGTYAIIGLESGKLQEMFVEGIYEADGQLTVNVVPPKPLQHIATGWSTHDANWFLDFPTSAQKVIWFFERTGGGKVDGVLTLNIEVIEQLLTLTGPIPMEEYEIVLDVNNFRDEIQYEVEVAYDKKLNRPKKILADFTPLFLEKLFEVSKNKNKELISLLIDALEQKYMMLYFRDKKAQEFFDAQGWTGSVKCQLPVAHTDSPQGGSCQLSDYLAIVHSNIGGHKTDKYMEDMIEYHAEIKDDGSAVGNVIVKRTHKGGNIKYWWYNKKNLDYVKVYVPKGAHIISSTGGLRREPDAPDYKALGFIEDVDVSLVVKNTKSFGPIDIFEESGKTVFGTWLATGGGSSSELRISYRFPSAIEFKEGVGKYNLYMQKQPGTKINANVSLSYPENWEILWGNAESRELTQSLKLDKDKVIGYIFSK